MAMVAIYEWRNQMLRCAGLLKEQEKLALLQRVKYLNNEKEYYKRKLNEAAVL